MPDTIRTEAEMLGIVIENSTGQITAQDIRDFVVSCNIDGTTAHLVNTNNPHNVTASQVGAPASIAGVSHPGGDIAISAGTNITVTPDNTGKSITIASSAGGGSGNVNYKGTWTPATAYSANDEIQYGNTTYVALSSTTGNQPPNGTYWQAVGTLGTVFNVKDYGASGSSNQYTGSITATSATLTLGSSHDFKVGHGIVVRGAGASHTIAAPSAPVVSNAGTAGAATYTYRLCSLTGDGGWSAVGTATSTTTGNAALGTSNYNNICWDVVSGNTLGGFVIYGRASGSDFALTVVNAACTNCRKVTFQSAGYVNATQSDVGQVLTTASGYNGTLLAYDNTNLIWYIYPLNWPVDTFSASHSVTMASSGAGGTTTGASTLAYYWSDKGDTETYQYKTLGWRPYYEHTEGDWILQPFSNTGSFYKAYKARYNHKTGATSPTLTNTLNWSSSTPDGNVYWRREEPFFPALPPSAAEPNALIAIVSSVSGNTITLTNTASNTATSELVYHDDTVACQKAHAAMSTSGINSITYFPSGVYQFITGTLANDTRWGTYGPTGLSAALFSVTSGTGLGWQLGNDAQVRVMALGMNAWMNDTLVAGQTNVSYALHLMRNVNGWVFRGTSATSKISWEGYGTALAEDGDSHNGYLMSDTYSGGSTDTVQNVLWENLTIEGFPIVTARFSTDTQGCQGERFVNTTFDYGGGSHDNALFVQGGTSIERCCFVSRRVNKSRAIYGASWTQFAIPIASVNTSTNVVTTTTTHGLLLGQPVTWRPSYNTAMPSGTVKANTTYYVGSVTSTTFKLYPTLTDANNSTNAITITSSVTSSAFNLVYHIVDQIVVSNSVFDRSGSPGRYCIEVRSDNFLVSNCSFRNVGAVITLDSSLNAGFVNNTFTNSALIVQGPLMTVNGNMFIDSSVSVASAYDTTVSGNAFWSTGAYTTTGLSNINSFLLSIASSVRVSVTGNSIDSPYANCVSFNGTDQSNCIGNTILSPASQYNIRVAGTGTVAIRDNILNGVGATIVAGIQADSGSPSLEISDNYINLSTSIYTSGSGQVRCIGNYCTGIVNLTGTGEHILQNNEFIYSGANNHTLSGGNIALLDSQFGKVPSTVTGVVRARNNKYPAGIDYIANTNVNGITYTPNAAVYALHDLTLTATGNTIAAPTGSNVGDTITIFLKQDATGGRTATFNAVYRMGTFSQTTTASKMDVLTFRYDGTNWNLTSLVQGL